MGAQPIAKATAEKLSLAASNAEAVLACSALGSCSRFSVVRLWSPRSTTGGRARVVAASAGDEQQTSSIGS